MGCLVVRIVTYIAKGVIVVSLYNGYVRCKFSERSNFTTDKIYEVENGCLITDNGLIFTSGIESFNDLQQYSVYASWEELELVKCDKYKVGDYVILNTSDELFQKYPDMFNRFLNRACRITDEITKGNSPHIGVYHLDYTLWYFTDISFLGKLIPKAAMVKSNHLKTKDWTNNEIKKARHIVTEYIKMLARSRTTLVFYTSTKSIKCCLIKIQTNSSEIDVVRENTAFCKDNDIFNVDIGMCVAACKVLNKPIPDFILNK